MNTAASNSSIRPLDILTSTTRSETTGTSVGNVKAIRMILQVTFSLVPIVAGLDKFTNLLTHWEAYLNPALARILPISPHAFMEVAGVIEIVAGIIVFFRPRVGALIVTGWLVSIALSLLASGHFLDVAVRDLVMAVASFSLASLTPSIDKKH